MKIKLTKYHRDDIERRVKDEDAFYDSSSVEHMYICREFLALIKCMEDGHINVEPGAAGFVFSHDFNIGFASGDYEVVE